MSVVCRTCLHQIYDDNFLSINDSTVVKNQLSQCIPEMTLSLVTNSIMCTACSAALDFAYNFKSRCLQAEKHILNHMNETASSSNIDGTRLIEILFKPLTNGIKRELIVPDEPQVDYFMSTEEVAVDDDENATDDCTNDEHSLEGGIEIMKQDLEDPDYKPCDAFPVVDNPFSSLTSIEEEADVSSGETLENMDYPNFEEYNLNDSSIVNRKPWKNGLKATYRDLSPPRGLPLEIHATDSEIIHKALEENNRENSIENPKSPNRFLGTVKRKRGRKSFGAETRTVRQHRKDMRNLGKEYTTRTNKTVKARTCKSLSQCRRKCNERVDCDTRQQLFAEYWTMGNYNKRVAYLRSLIDAKEKKTTRTKTVDLSKQKSRFVTYIYHFRINGALVQVCKGCFLRTYDETNKFVTNVLRKRQLWNHRA